MVTSRTYPEENLIKSTDLKYPITIESQTNSKKISRNYLKCSGLLVKSRYLRV
ncbi:phage protein [Streptococcus dysgalactiae subsp. equisimilis]|nr:phage protein [Streptococcus dysgalactiae subsp. equisimilis]